MTFSGQKVYDPILAFKVGVTQLSQANNTKTFRKGSFWGFTTSFRTWLSSVQ